MSNIYKQMKQISIESMGLEPEVVLYPESMIPECHIACDQYDAALESAELIADAFFGAATMNQEIVLESAGLDIEHIGDFQGELATEAIQDKIKMAYYSGKIAVKKVLAKIVKFFKAIFAYITGTNGRLDSYSKLAEKYGKKLKEAKSNDKANEKKIKVTVYDDLDKAIQAYTKMFVTDQIKHQTTLLKESKNLYPRELAVIVKGALGAIAPKKEAQQESKADNAPEKTSEELREEMNNVIDNIKDRIKEMDSEEFTIVEAKNKYITYMDIMKKSCESKVDIKKEFSKFVTAFEKAISSMDTNNSKGTQEDVDDDIIKSLNKKLDHAIIIKTFIGKLYKVIVGLLQKCLADAAKVISAATSINA